MTSSANDEWDYEMLILGIKLLEALKVHVESLFDCESCQEAINFIEYNMREMEITGGNGD